jgi:hypothetical protein
MFHDYRLAFLGYLMYSLFVLCLVWHVLPVNENLMPIRLFTG